MYGVRFSSTQGNSIILSNLSVTTTGTANAYTGGNTTLTLYVDGVAKSTKSLNTASVSFDTFNTTISTSKAVDMVIKADFSDVTNTGSFSVASITYSAVDSLTSATITPVTVAGATFNIDQAAGTLAAATGDAEVVNKTLLEAGTFNKRIASFKVTASNDTVKLKTITLSGTGFSALSNIQLQTSAGVVLGTVASLTDTGAVFENLDTASGASIAMDKSAVFFVVANVNSNTNFSGVQINVVTSGSKITGTNGAEVAMIGVTATGASHDVNENTFKITQATPTSKEIASDALRFKVTASGKNSVTLSGANFTNQLTGYTGSFMLEVIRSSDQSVLGSATGSTGIITFTANNTIDAGSTVEFQVRIRNAIKESTSQQSSWQMTLGNLYTTSGLDAANYPKNTDTFPLRSNN